jgi:hypothetical protein
MAQDSSDKEQGARFKIQGARGKVQGTRSKGQGAKSKLHDPGQIFKFADHQEH